MYGNSRWSHDERLAFKKGCEKGEAEANEKSLASIAENLADIRTCLFRIAESMDRS